jgi:sporulation protein YlmC with PRC-barrel domain
MHKHITVKDINEVTTDANLTNLEVTGVIINEDGSSTGELQNLIIEIDTLAIVQTFNTTWTNNAIGKLRRWLNDLTK